MHAADLPQHVPEVDHAEEEHGDEDDVAPSPRVLFGHKMEPRPPCSFVLAQRTKESQPTSQEGGEMADCSNRKDHRASFHPHHPWSLPSEQRTLSLLLCTICSEFHNNNNNNRSDNFRQKSEVPPSLLTSYNGNNLTRMQRISVPALQVNNPMKTFAKALRVFMAGPPVSSYHCSVQCGAATRTKTSSEADEPDNNHEEKQKTHRE